MTLNTAQLRVIAMSMYHYFRGLDKPPAKDMLIPISAIKPDKKDKNTFSATIRYVVDYCGLKEHSVRIKFMVDDQGRFRNDTWSYV